MDSWVLPLVLLTALGYAVIYNMGTNIFMPGGISYITQSIAAILQLGVTMDYSVFLLDRFNEELEKTDNRTEAMTKAIAATFTSLAGSSLTTVFGFLALCFMSFTLGLDIGIVMAKGVLLGVLTVVTVLPSFIILFYKPIYRFRHKRLIPNFKPLNEFIVKHRKVFAVIFLALIIPSYIAKSLVPLDYNVSNALPEQLDSVQALIKMKTDFNMATTHFVIIHDDVPSGKVSQMIDEIEDVEGISNVISLNSFVGPAISGKVLPDAVKDICFKNGWQLMMVNSVYNTASDEENAQIDTLTEIVKKYDPAGYLTGEGVMSKDLIAVTSKDFRITSILSIGAIFILIAIFFKSIAVPVFLVLAIELAIFINLACALVTGADVSFIAPTIISCVQLGATVDYAILMTSRFREELKSGKDKVTAMIDAAKEADKSICQSALVFFCATFGVYCVCNIEIVKSICSMLARGAAISGIVIIVFLPAILAVFEGVINKLTVGWKSSPAAGEKGEEEKMKSSSVKKIIALGTVISILFCMTACGQKETETAADSSAEVKSVSQPVYTAAPGSVSKAETVYININNDGSVADVNVTDWIHTDKGEVCVYDKSSLENIESIKDNTVPVSDENGINWNMRETDLYYSGTSDKKPPVEIKLTYYLDGKKISPEKLIGKDGKVKIAVEMKNNMSVEKTVNGHKQKIYLPILVVGGFLLPEADFSGVKVDGGRAIGDGTKEIAVMFGVPGMSESLGLDALGIKALEGPVIGGTASVTADAKDFSLSNMYFAAIPISSLNLDIEAGDSMEDIKSLLAVIKQLQNTLTGMNPDQLIKAFSSGASDAGSMADVLSEAVELYNSNKALINVLSKYATPENSKQIKQLLEFLTNEDTAKALTILSDSSVVKFFSGLSELGDTVPLANSLIKDLQDPEVAKAIENLPSTLEKLENIRASLEKNSDSIDYLISLLSEDNIKSLSGVLSMLGDINFEDLEKKYSSLVENGDITVERFQEWIQFGKDYKIFTDAADNMTTSVLFVYMTPPLEKEEKTTGAETEKSGESILDSFIKKFK
jgi:hypothetical protein